MKESDIRPNKIFDQFLHLSSKEIKVFFANCEYEKALCPACGSTGKNIFEKLSFQFDECGRCSTWYLNPRPEYNAFRDFYTKSEASRYWASTFYEQTKEARSSLIWKPKAAYVQRVCQSRFLAKPLILDIGAGYGLFADHIRELGFADIILVEPNSNFASVCRDKGFEVIESFAEDLKYEKKLQVPKIITCFELFEHIHDIEQFTSAIKAIMEKGDLFLFSTLSNSGLDISLLREKSKSVSPPHHINFLNPKSVTAFLERLGFKNIIVETPGLLDVDILHKQVDQIENDFFRNFFQNSNASSRRELQEFLIKTGTSSHMIVRCSLQ